jgi:hypothetical protein
MLSCYNAQVRSILSYGAEVWGPGAVAKLFARTGSKTLFQLKWRARRKNEFQEGDQ